MPPKTPTAKMRLMVRRIFRKVHIDDKRQLKQGKLK